MQAKPRMKKRKKRRTKVIGIGLIAVVVVCCIAGLLIYSYAAKSYDGQRKRIYVDATAGEAGLRDSIVAKLGEDYGGRVFAIWGKLSSGSELKSGSYVVEPGEKAWQLARRIKNHRQDPVKVTFNNLRTFGQLMASLDAQLLADSASLVAATTALLEGEAVGPANYAAHFLPDTYEFYWDETAEGVVKKITDNYNQFWNEKRREQAAALRLTPDEVSTLASIVEEETNKSDERPKVARLYLNRLKSGMRLQADPTVKFALGDFGLRRLLNKHLQVNSKYNTYLYGGLPPGPIRLPQATTLDAVLNAPEHSYIYMCAKEDFSGYHNFATDYATHQANASKYRAALDRNGY